MLERKKLADDLEKQTRQFAVSIIQISVNFQVHLKVELLESTNKGRNFSWRNYREAIRARSKADLKTKFKYVKVNQFKRNTGWRLLQI